jgi:hypothetical protein
MQDREGVVGNGLGHYQQKRLPAVPKRVVRIDLGADVLGKRLGAIPVELWRKLGDGVRKAA